MFWNNQRILALVFFLVAGNACAKLSLDGRWKIVDYRLPGIGISDFEAQENLGRVANIKSGILEIEISGKKFKCRVFGNLENTISADVCDEFSPDNKVSINVTDFKFTPRVYYLHTKRISESIPSVGNVIVDSKSKNMILIYDGAFYLLKRQNKKDGL